MAEKKGSVFEYYKEKQSQDNAQIAKCKFCTTSIKGKIGVSSNFVTHLKVK